MWGGEDVEGVVGAVAGDAEFLIEGGAFRLDLAGSLPPALKHAQVGGQLLVEVQDEPLALEHGLALFLCAWVAILVGRGIGGHRHQPDVAQFHMDAPVCAPHMVAADHIVKPEGKGHIDALDQTAVDVSILLILQILKHLGEHHRNYCPAQIVPHFPPGAVLGRNADPQNQQAGTMNTPSSAISRWLSIKTAPPATMKTTPVLLFLLAFSIRCSKSFSVWLAGGISFFSRKVLSFLSVVRPTVRRQAVSLSRQPGLLSLYCLYKVSTVSRASISSVT